MVLKVDAHKQMAMVLKDRVLNVDAHKQMAMVLNVDAHNR